nr:DUF2190 family protein [uncultured Sphaerochaeta sp.]
MARNFVQPGGFVTLTIPAGGLGAGAGYLVGSLFGVAMTGGTEGDEDEFAMTGVFDLPKKPGDTPSIGGKLYWDSANKHLTTTATGNTYVGVALIASGGADTTVRIRLNGMV